MTEKLILCHSPIPTFGTLWEIMDETGVVDAITETEAKRYIRTNGFKLLHACQYGKIWGHPERKSKKVYTMPVELGQGGGVPPTTKQEYIKDSAKYYAIKSTDVAMQIKQLLVGMKPGDIYSVDAEKCSRQYAGYLCKSTDTQYKIRTMGKDDLTYFYCDKSISQ